MDHDTAYVEAVGSLHTEVFNILVWNYRKIAMARFFVIKPTMTKPGVQPSCGPRTSRLMVKVLLEEVQRLAIPVLTSATVIKLLHQRDENGEAWQGQSSRPVIAPITWRNGNDCAQCGTGNRRAPG